MTKASKASAFWFIRDGAKLRQCTHEDFNNAVRQGKSVKYCGYPNRKTERIAESLEASRMKHLATPDLSPKFRAALTDPQNVIDVQIISLRDPEFWVTESRNSKYKK